MEESFKDSHCLDLDVDALLVAMLVRSMLTLVTGKVVVRVTLPLFVLVTTSAFQLNVDTWFVLALLALDLSRGSVSAFSLSLH